jgi:WD40 repeat protein
VEAIDIEADGERVVTGGAERILSVWNIPRRAWERDLEEDGLIPGVAFLTDKRHVASASGSRLRVRDVTAQTEGYVLAEAEEGQSWFQVAVSRNGNNLLATSSDALIHLFDLKNRNEVCSFRGHVGVIRRAAFSPQGEYIVSCGLDRQVILWDARRGREIRRFIGHTSDLEWVGFSPDGRVLLATEGLTGPTPGPDQGVRFWAVSSGRPLHRFGGIPEAVHCAAFSPDGRQVAVGCGDKRVRLYDVAGITLRFPLTPLTDPKVRAPVVLVPSSREGSQPWRYVVAQPGADWIQPTYDDSAWARGEGGFGTRNAQGAVVRTDWTTSDIWLRRTFDLPRLPEGEILLEWNHDDDAEVYLNGILAAQAGGYTTGYEPVLVRPEARQALRAGGNVLAVHCRNVKGPQYIDAGLLVQPR